MALNEFYLKDEIRNELICAFCKNELDQPKVIPCGKTVCTACEHECFKVKDPPECPSCWDQHKIPADGFPVNEIVQRVLEKQARTIYRGEIHKKTIEKIHEIGLFTRKFEFELSTAESMVSEHCDILRSNIDVKTESMIQAMNSYREQFMSKVNDYEHKCIEKCVNLDEYKNFITKCQEKYSSCVNYINSHDITDIQTEKMLNEIIELKNQMHIFDQKFNQQIFEKKKLQFYENESLIGPSIIGVLSSTDELNIDFENLLNEKPLFKIKYEDSANILDDCLFEIPDNKYCLVISSTEDVNFSGYYCLKIKILSEYGEIVSETVTEINQGYFQFSAARFQNYIAIAAFFNGSFNQLRLYDTNLNIVNSIQMNYFEPQLFTIDKKIFVRSTATSYLYIYNEKLDLEESLLMSNPEMYPFLMNPLARMVIKFGKVYSFFGSKITIADMETRTLSKKIDLGSEYNQDDFMFEPLSDDTFLTFDFLKKYLKVFNLDLECLMEFKIERLEEVSSFSVTESGHFVIYDSKDDLVYVF